MKKESIVERLEKERNDLAEKLGRLIQALNSESFEETVGETQMALLADQESAMRLYLRTLDMRIADLKGKKEKPQKENQESKAEKKGKPENPDKTDETSELDKEMKDVLDRMNKIIDRIREEIANRQPNTFLKEPYPGFWSSTYSVYC